MDDAGCYTLQDPTLGFCIPKFQVLQTGMLKIGPDDAYRKARSGRAGYHWSSNMSKLAALLLAVALISPAFAQAPAPAPAAPATTTDTTPVKVKKVKKAKKVKKEVPAPAATPALTTQEAPAPVDPCL